MAYKTLTISNIVARVKTFLIGIGVTDTSLDTEIKYALDYIVQTTIAQAHHPAFRVESVLQLAKSVSDYTMPDDFHAIIEPGVKFTDSPNWTLIWFDQQDYDRLELDNRFSNESRPRYYTLRGRDHDSGLFTFRVTPKPDSGYTVVYSYFGLPDDIIGAADTDVIDRRFPIEYHRLLVLGAVIQFPQCLSRDLLLSYKADYQEMLKRILLTNHPVIGNIVQNRPYRGFRSRTGTLETTITAGEDVPSV